LEAGSRGQFRPAIHNRRDWARESEGPCSREASNDRGAKGPNADEPSQRKEERLSRRQLFQDGTSGVDARTGESWERSETAAAPLSTETEAGPKGQTGTQVRFYTLYGRICDRQTLVAAWNQVRANGGAPGVDGISIEGVVKSEAGRNGFSMRLKRNCARNLSPPAGQEGVYPQGQRETETAGIPTIRDRVVQTQHC